MLEESVLNDCTPEVKTHCKAGLPYIEQEPVYQSYTALSMKYPEPEVVSKDVGGEIKVHHQMNAKPEMVCNLLLAVIILRRLELPVLHIL